MKFDIDDKTLRAIRKTNRDFFVKLYLCNTWSGYTRNLWSGVLEAKNERLVNYNKYEYEGINFYIDKKVETTHTLRVRANPKLPLLRQSYTVKGVY